MVNLIPSWSFILHLMVTLTDLVFTFRRMLLFHPDRDWRQHEERRAQKTLMFIVENLKKLLEDRYIWHGDYKPRT
jgi:hypothetical protein